MLVFGILHYALKQVSVDDTWLDESPFPVGILYNFADTGGTNVANFYQ
jgi:hypothetical protein